MMFYSGQRMRVDDWSHWLSRLHWRRVRFFGVVVGRYFIGVQAFGRDLPLGRDKEGA